MIPAKIDPISFIPVSGKEVDSIANWFDQHNQSFYFLGWSYLRNQQQMEELFYRAILKVHKEFPKINRETTFEMWVTSIFIQTCRELSKVKNFQAEEEGLPRQDLFIALDELKEDEKEAVVLTYLKGISLEDAAKLLRVSTEKIKQLLFSGIQSLKRGFGFERSLNGCKEYHKYYIDYFERTLSRPEKVDFEIHIYHCRDCQDDLAAFQDVMLTMKNFDEGIEGFHVPTNFMANVRARLAEREKTRQLKRKKRIRMATVFASIFTLLISLEVLTGSFTGLYYAYAEKDEQLRGFLRQGMGKMLNLEAESEGLKIRIKSAVTDEFQTLIFYEIEDTADEHQYMIFLDNGAAVENHYQIMKSDNYPRFYPPDLESEANNKEKNVYRGKITLSPLKKEKATIQLKITKLQKVNRDVSSLHNVYFLDEAGSKTVEWKFEIPVVKQPFSEYALDQETEVDGIPVRLEKLIIAPTATILRYSIQNGLPNKRIEYLSFNNLEVNNKKAKAEKYGNNYIEEKMGWITFQAHFDPLFKIKPKEVNLQLESAVITVEDKKTVELDASKRYPQTFEYAGSTISIEKFEIGKPTVLVMSNHEINNRAFDSLWFDVEGDYDEGTTPMEIDPEGVLFDKNGVEHDSNDIMNFEKIEQPRYFTTVYTLKLQSGNSEEKAIPKRILLHGYHKTRYFDDVMAISVK
ncbi:sigma-70 family RNA polymerase sigma factor [Neobacillus notoginsengisoli]|uniref:Sigma-70 family RNA polymerase sigma factor n=1 Tax=Neobacillus notoginsengisoli TaxID=1578198 RepID=A0A417YVX5_9BACI|nr:sigma-70 family RNA polymerase sigma factor [Neobacillus notoginsengisoli]RHW41431.1 sigma-70 family RNA polymerase sigma factor [Neobacillus notoginsengisoli]